MQASSLARFYHISPTDLRDMDEIQVQNRMADIKRLVKYERDNIALAVWGAKKENEGEESKKRGRRAH